MHREKNWKAKLEKAMQSEWISTNALFLTQCLRLSFTVGIFCWFPPSWFQDIPAVFDLILSSCSRLTTFVIKYGTCSVIWDVEWDQGKGPVGFNWVTITEFQPCTVPLPGRRLKIIILVNWGRLFRFNSISNDFISNTVSLGLSFCVMLYMVY